MKYVDGKNLSDYQRGIYEVTESLMNAFAWCLTPQGFNYWEQVYDNLIDLIKADIDIDKAHGVR